MDAIAARAGCAFDLDDDRAYLRWREAKLEAAPRRIDELIVEVADPRRLSAAERGALLARCRRANLAVYRSPRTEADPALPLAIASQLGLARLDANWLAGEDGVSRIEVRAAGGSEAADYVPYTERAIGWHTDGYYHPERRRIRAMLLHCVRAADQGGANTLLDPELAYLRLRDADPEHVRALMQDDAMTIPARTGEHGVARAAQSGPVFALDAGRLHMRYTARTRSIAWRADGATRAAAAALRELLAGAEARRLALTLAPGMGIVCNNVLHERSAFEDDPARPRLLYRARFLDRVAER